MSLDLSQDAPPTPGVYHGRVAGTTDRLNFETKQNPDGTTLLRACVSDSEPEPAGDVQWFAESVRPPQFAIRSKIGDATIDVRYENGTVMGTLTSPGGESFPMLGPTSPTPSGTPTSTASPVSTPRSWPPWTVRLRPEQRLRRTERPGGSTGVNIIGLDKKC